MSKIFFILSIFLVFGFSSDFENDLKDMQSRNPKELKEIKKFAISINVQGYEIKNNKIYIKVVTEQLEQNKPYVGVLSNATLVVYKDQKELESIVTSKKLSAERIKDDGKGHWTNKVKYLYTVIDKYDKNPHEYIFSIHKVSDSRNVPFCLLKYTRFQIGDSSSRTASKVKLYKEIINDFRKKIQKAQNNCKKKLKELQNQVTFTHKEWNEKKYKMTKITQQLLNHKCKIKMDYGYITVADANKKISGYLSKIIEINKKSLPPITDANIDKLKMKYFNKIEGDEKYKLQKLHQKMLSKVDKLLPTEELPDYFSSLGFTKPKTTDQKTVDIWRKKIKKALEKGWVNALSTEDTAALKNHIKKELKILNKYTDANKFSSDGAVDIVNANQQITNDIISALPVLDTEFDIINILRGEDITGKKLTTLDYLFTLVPAGIGTVNSKYFKKLEKKFQPLSNKVKSKVAQKLKVVTEKIELDPRFYTKNVLVKKNIKKQSLKYKASPKWLEREKIYKEYKKSITKKVDINTDLSKLTSKKTVYIQEIKTELKSGKKYFDKLDNIDKKLKSVSDKTKKYNLELDKLKELDQGIFVLNKSYKNQIEPFARKYLGSSKKIPVDIRESMKLYDDVLKGKLNPIEANFIIKNSFGYKPKEFFYRVENYLDDLNDAKKRYQSSYATFLRELKISADEGNLLKAVNMSIQAFQNNKIDKKECENIKKELLNKSQKFNNDVKEKIKRKLEKSCNKISQG